MALRDNAVFTASSGFIFKAPVGTKAPTRAEIRDFNPDTFGSNTHKLLVTDATGGSYKLTVGGQATADIPLRANAADVQAAIEKVTSVGKGNVLVIGGNAVDGGLTIAFVGAHRKKNLTVTGDNAKLTSSSTAKVTVKELSKFSEWESIGHTGKEDLPEFGYEGGDKETKGTWQKSNLKEVTTEQPVDYVTMKLLQFDNDSFELYYGKNASTEEGVFGIDGGDAPAVEYAILIVLIDGENKIGFTAPKTSIRRDESIGLAQDDFSTLPIRSTFTKYPGRMLFQWITPAPAA